MHQPFASTDTRRHLWLDPKVSATFSPRIARFVSTNTLPNTSFPHFSPEFRSPFAFRTNPLYRVGLDVFLRALLAGWMDQFNDTNAHEMHILRKAFEDDRVLFAVANSLHYSDNVHFFVDLALLELFVSPMPMVEKEVAKALDPVIQYAVHLFRGSIVVTSLTQLPRPPYGYMNPDTPSYTTTGLLADLDRRPMIGMRALKKVIDNVLAANQGRIPPPSSPPRLGELTLHHRDSDLVSSHEALGDATVNLIASKLLVSNYDLSLPDFTMLYHLLKSNKLLALLAPFIYVFPQCIWPPFEGKKLKPLADQFEYEIGFLSRTDDGFHLVGHALFSLFQEAADIVLGALYPGKILRASGMKTRPIGDQNDYGALPLPPDWREIVYTEATRLHDLRIQTDSTFFKGERPQREPVSPPQNPLERFSLTLQAPQEGQAHGSVYLPPLERSEAVRRRRHEHDRQTTVPLNVPMSAKASAEVQAPSAVYLRSFDRPEPLCRCGHNSQTASHSDSPLFRMGPPEPPAMPPLKPLKPLQLPMALDPPSQPSVSFVSDSDEEDHVTLEFSYFAGRECRERYSPPSHYWQD